jgi:hypothetical protein
MLGAPLRVLGPSDRVFGASVGVLGKSLIGLGFLDPLRKGQET